MSEQRFARFWVRGRKQSVRRSLQIMARAAAMQSRVQSDGTCELNNVVGSGRQCIHCASKLHLQGASVRCKATEHQEERMDLGLLLLCLAR